MSAQIFFLYLLTWTVVALTPGPAVMCAMAQATRHGVRLGLAGIFGIQAGNLLFFMCVGFGLGTLLATATTAFTVLRIVGAIYLFYLGMRIIIGSFRRKSTQTVELIAQPVQRRNLFLQGLLIQITNPKALLFVSALLPQFIRPERPLVLQLCILAAATIGVDAVVLTSYACFAAKGAASFRKSKLSGWLERAVGATLVFFGLRLLLSRK
jgi:homoserine/homoserine lactone efflux protein